MDLIFKLIIYLFCFLFIFLKSGISETNETADNQYENVVIDSIEIKNGDIFDLSLKENQNWLFRLTNKLHINTKKRIIKRELLLRKGDLFSFELAEETERNLRSLPYLYNAKIEMLETDSGLNLMKVTTSDRWSLAGGPSISRNSGELIYQLGFEELNFLGNGQRLSFDYFIREFDENFIRASFYERRLFGSRLGWNLFHNANPEVGSLGFNITKPLYSLNSKFGYGISFTDIDRVDKEYYSGSEFARNRYESKQFGLSTVYRFGSYFNKVSLGFSYSYKDINISDETLFNSLYSFTFPSDSIYATYVFSLGASSIKYIREKRLDGIIRSEDIVLGANAGVSVGYAFDVRSQDRLFRTLSFSGGYSNRFGPNIIFLGFNRTFWYDGGIDYRNRTNVSIKYYNRMIAWLTPVVLAQYVEDWRLEGQEALFLGENSGLRGYPRYYRQGEKLIRINFENRFFTGIKMLSAEFGITQFLDVGQTWSYDERFEFKNNLWSVGVGLRVGTEKVSSREMIRIDLAYAGKIKEWQISFGVGQYF